MASTSKIATQMRYDSELYEKTKIIAEREFRTANAQIEYFMKKGIDEYEAQHGRISLSQMTTFSDVLSGADAGGLKIHLEEDND